MCRGEGDGGCATVGGTMEFVFDFIKVDLNNFLNAFVGDAHNSPSPSPSLSLSLSPSASVYSLHFTVLI